MLHKVAYAHKKGERTQSTSRILEVLNKILAYFCGIHLPKCGVGAADQCKARRPLPTFCQCSSRTAYPEGNNSAQWGHVLALQHLALPLQKTPLWMALYFLEAAHLLVELGLA